LCITVIAAAQSRHRRPKTTLPPPPVIIGQRPDAADRMVKGPNAAAETYSVGTDGMSRLLSLVNIKEQGVLHPAME